MLHGLEAKTAAPEEVRAWLEDAHRETLRSIGGLSPGQLRNPKLPVVNPFLWMVGHAAWFSERWILRHLRGAPPLLADGDDLYDSFKIPWAVRWDLPIPDEAGTLRYLAGVRDEILAGLDGGRLSGEETYFHRLGVFHEDMHREANLYFRQTHGYGPPPALPGAQAADGGPNCEIVHEPPAAGALDGDAEIPGCPDYRLGGTPDLPFVFDNEKWAHPVPVRPFRIARAPVSNVQFQEFVEAGGYAREEHWSYGGRLWLAETQARHPAYWRREAAGRWLRRHFDRWVPLEPHHPVIHVSGYEAEAFCAWAGRRLPSEAEWELAASGEQDRRGSCAPVKRRYPWGDAAPTPERANLNGWYGGCVDVGALPAGDSAFGCRQMVGNVWEWTADAFYPFPGFVVDPYREYSAPWFGYHRVLRGGAWMTAARLIRNTWRNYFQPRRLDIPAGFRTCAP